MLSKTRLKRSILARTIAALSIGGGMLAFSAAISPTAQAGQYWWDIDSNVIGAGGATPNGTWSSGGTTWSTDSTGATVTSAYTTLNTDDLVFSAGTNATGAYTIGLTSSQAAQSLRFEDGTATISGSGGIITLAGTGNITVALGASAIIGANTSTKIDGTAGLTKLGVGTLTLNGSAVNTFTGGLNLNGGTLLLDFANLGTPTDLVASQAVSLGGGTLSIRGKSTGATTQNLGNVTVNAGGGQILGDKNGGTSTTINLGTITATAAGSSLLLGAGGTNANLPVITTTSNNDASGILGGRVVYFNGTASTGYDFAISTTGTVGAYSSYTAMPLTGGSSTTNYSTSAGGTLSGSLAANNLKIVGSATALALGANTLTLTSGGLLSTGSTAQTISGTAGATRLTAGDGLGGTADLVIHQYNSAGAGLTVSAVIGNNTAGSGNTVNVVKAGSGYLALTGVNTYTGNTYINQGQLDYQGTTPAGSGRNVYVAPGAIVRFSAVTNTLLNRIAQTNEEIGVFGGTTANSFDFSTATGANLPNAFYSTWASNGAKNEYSGTLTPAADNYRLGFTGQNGLLGLTNSAPMTGTQGLIIGGGSVELVGAKTFSGVTIIRDGARLGLATTTLGTPALGLQNSPLYTGTSTNTGTFWLESGGASGPITGSVATTSATFGGLSGSRNLASVYSTTTGANNSAATAVTSVVGFNLNPGSGVDLTYSGIIADFAPGTTITKSGLGNQTFAGANTYTGSTTVSAGTLTLSNALALQNSALVTTGAGTVILSGFTTPTFGGLSGATGDLSSVISNYNTVPGITLNPQSGSVSYGGAINNGAGSTTLTKTGAGTQILTGTNTYSGATTVNAGTLLVNGSGTLTASAVTVGNGATFGGDGTIGSTVVVKAGSKLSAGSASGNIGTLTISNNTLTALTLNNSNLVYDINAGATSADRIDITGNTVLNGTNMVLLNLPTGTAIAQTSSPLTLMTYGSKSGSGAITFANGQTTLGNASLAVSGTDVQLSIASGGLNQSVWVGTGATAAWDTSSTFWTRNGAATQAYQDGDFVTIDDTATATTITSASAVTPAMVTVNNSTKTFVITATIGGTGTPLVKTGTGTLTLGSATVAPANSYTGGTLVLGGILNLAGASNTNVDYLLGSSTGAITLNGGQLKASSTNLSGARQVTVGDAGGSLFVNKNNTFTTTGKLTGSGTLSLLDGGGSGGLSTYNFNSTSNDFTGGLALNNSVVGLNSLPDSSNNIVFTAAATNNGGGLTYGASATSPLTFGASGRALELNSSAAVTFTITNNNTTQPISFAKNLVATGAGAKTLALAAVAGPANIFSGVIADKTDAGTGTVAITKSGAGTWVLSGANTYTGLTTVSASGGTLAGIGANAFGSSAISLSSGTLSLRGDTSTSFVKASDSSPYVITTTVTGATIDVAAATTNTSAKTMTIGALGTSSVAASYQVNFTGSASDNTSLSVGAVTGPVSTAAGTVTLSNTIPGTGALTLASYTGANTLGGETLTFTGNGNTTVTGNVLKSAGTSLALSKSGTGTLTLSGSGNTFDGTMTLTGTTASSGTLAYASAGGANPITFAATTSFNSIVDYVGSSPLTMSGLITASALTSGGIQINANGTVPTATINYSNTSSLSTGNAATTQAFIGFNGANTGDNIFAGNIANNTGAGGSRQVSKSGAGKWVFTGNSTYTGGFFLNQGTVSVSSIGDGTVSGPLGINTRINIGRDNNDGTLMFTGSGSTTNRDVRIGGPSTASGTGGSTIVNNGSGALTFTATTFNPTQTGINFSRTLTLGGSYTGAANTIQGVIQDNTAGTGLVGVTKTDAGTWALTGSNTYTGPTNVLQGKLLINGNQATATGPVTVASGATLGGTGPLGGAVTVQSGGFYSPGNSPGLQNLGSGLTVSAGATYNWEHIAGNAVGAAGTDFDVANITGGTFTANNTAGTGSKLALYFDASTNFSDSFWNGNQSWNIVTGGVSGSNFFNSSNISLFINNAPATTGGEGSFQTAVSGSNLQLQWVANTGGTANFIFTDTSAVTLNVLKGGTGITTTKTIQNNGTATGDATLNNGNSNLSVSGNLTGITSPSGTSVQTLSAASTSSYGAQTGTLTVLANTGGSNSVSTTVNVGEASFNPGNTRILGTAPVLATTATNTVYQAPNWESRTNNLTATAGGPASVNTVATVLMYNNTTGSGTETVGMQWRTRTTAEAAPSNVNAVLSDVVNLTGMYSGAETAASGTGAFVLQMSYLQSTLNDLGLNENSIAVSGELRLGWHDLNDDSWKTAALGNNNGTGTGTFVGITSWSAYYAANGNGTGTDLASFVGKYGVDPSDPSGGKVWAVLNHNSEFAVIPEPSTFVLGGLALLGFAGVGLRRRRGHIKSCS